MIFLLQAIMVKKIIYDITVVHVFYACLLKIAGGSSYAYRSYV
jgi:hypothetical protein